MRFLFPSAGNHLVSFRLQILSVRVQWLQSQFSFQKLCSAASCLLHTCTFPWLIWRLSGGLCNGSDLKVFAVMLRFPLHGKQPCMCGFELRQDLCYFLHRIRRWPSCLFSEISPTFSRALVFPLWDLWVGRHDSSWNFSFPSYLTSYINKAVWGRGER